VEMDAQIIVKLKQDLIAKGGVQLQLVNALKFVEMVKMQDYFHAMIIIS